MDVNQRIAQFETMVRPEADPNNDMAWFSLGKAYAEAGRHTEAAAAFARSCELNPAMTRAYQFAGENFIKSGDLSKAVDILRRGHAAAAERGDRMPQQAIEDLLVKLGEPVPRVATTKTASAAAAPPGSFVCSRTGRPGTRMARPPFRGPVGEWIRQNISKETFDAWIAQGTKVINELRLDLSRPEDEETYDRHMREFLGIDDDVLAKLKSPAPEPRTPGDGGTSPGL